MAEEKMFENRIKSFLDSEGVWHVKFFANAFTKVGVPDIVGCCNGRFIAIEVKASHGKPSALQLNNLHLIDNCGGYALLLYPDMFDDFKLMIRSINADHEFTAIEVYKKLKGRWFNASKSFKG